MPSDAARIADRKAWWNIHDKKDYICPDCGKTSSDRDFFQWEVHHINGEDGNVVALCHTCHWVRHGGDRKSLDLSVWMDEFQRIGES